MTKDHDKDAVEVIGDAIGKALDDSPAKWEQGFGYPHYLAKIALVADPLRQKLGPVAVRAILEGDAGVFSLGYSWVSDVWGRHGFWRKKPVRLDKPEEQKR